MDPMSVLELVMASDSECSAIYSDWDSDFDVYRKFDSSGTESENEAVNTQTAASSPDPSSLPGPSHLHSCSTSLEDESSPDPSSLPGPSHLHSCSISLEDERKKYNWQIFNWQPPVTSFTGTAGPTDNVVVNNVNSPLEYFKLFFNNSLMKLLVEESNLYAVQYLSRTPLSPKARAKDWKPVTAKELQVYFGLSLLTGIVQKKDRLSSYWSIDPVIATPFFSQCMSRDRFFQIHSFLHFNNNENIPGDCVDKFYKIRPVFDMIVPKWQTLYSLGEHISIDEGMLKWGGRLNFQLHNKDNPTKHCIKTYILTDSTSGFCWNMDIYQQGKKTLKETVDQLLTKKCKGLWHSLYMDNFCNSVELSEDLLAQKVHTIGTLRKNRGEPMEVRSPTLKKHEIISRHNGKVMVMAWKDKRIVNAITTKHDNSTMTITRRSKTAPGAKESYKKPTCICDYNKYMSGVDQMIAYCPCTIKTLKWTKRLFFYLMEICVHNSHVLYKAKSSSPRKLKLYDFQLKLIKELCEQHIEQKLSDSESSDVDTKPIKTPRHDPVRRLQGGFKSHHMVTYPPTEHKQNPQRRCRVCSKKHIRKETRYFCKQCKVPLCNTPCFANYHKDKHF